MPFSPFSPLRRLFRLLPSPVLRIPWTVFRDNNRRSTKQFYNSKQAIVVISILSEQIIYKWAIGYITVQVTRSHWCRHSAKIKEIFLLKFTALAQATYILSVLLHKSFRLPTSNKIGRVSDFVFIRDSSIWYSVMGPLLKGLNHLGVVIRCNRLLLAGLGSNIYLFEPWLEWA